MGKEGLLTNDQVADAYIKLLSWRYRFLVTPSAVLKTIALRHITNPPGGSLREISRYVHDCMRDPGLFSGFEPTDPPVTIGGKLFFDWAITTVNFIFELWAEQSIDQATLEAFTNWAIRELLPSPPKSIGDTKAQVIASLLPRFVMTQSFIRSIDMRDTKKANSCLLKIASELGLSMEDYSKYLLEVTNGIKT
jgi:hypothetical protein